MIAFDPEQGISDEMAEAILQGSAMAMMVTEVEGATPPEWSWMLEQLRVLLDTDGEAMGMVMAATATKAVMIPTPNGPHNPLRFILMMRALDQLDSICWVAVASDTYVRVGNEADLEDGLTPTEAFKQGLPGSREALLASCIAPDGPGYDVEQTYTRTDNGIVYDEPTIFPRANQGPLVDLMREVVMA